MLHRLTLPSGPKVLGSINGRPDSVIASRISSQACSFVPSNADETKERPTRRMPHER